MATAMYVFPVPPGPMPNHVLLSISSISALAGVLRRDLFFAEGTHAAMLKLRAAIRAVPPSPRAISDLYSRGESVRHMPGEWLYSLHRSSRLVDAAPARLRWSAACREMGAHAQRILETRTFSFPACQRKVRLSGNVNGTSHPLEGFLLPEPVADGIPSLFVRGAS